MALRYALYDLDGKAKRAVALDELATAVQMETIGHDKGCGYGALRGGA